MPQDNPITVGEVFRGRRGSKRRRERVTAGDRVVCALCGGVMGCSLWSLFFAVLFVGGLMIQSKPAGAARIAAGQAPADPWEVLPDYWWWAGLFATGWAGFGALAGPERMMDGFEKIARIQGDRSEDFLMDCSRDD